MDEHGAERKEQRHEHNIDKLQARTQAFDAAVELTLHRPQLLAYACLLVLEALDLGLLLRRHQQ